MTPLQIVWSIVAIFVYLAIGREIMVHFVRSCTWLLENKSYGRTWNNREDYIDYGLFTVAALLWPVFIVLMLGSVLIRTASRIGPAIRWFAAPYRIRADRENRYRTDWYVRAWWCIRRSLPGRRSYTGQRIK